MVAVLTLAVVVAAVGATPASAAQGDAGIFSDDDGVYYEAPLEALSAAGILAGTECGIGLICPDRPLRRWEMAVWLTRALDGEEPDAVSSSSFEDVDASEWWAPHIERFADLGITAGCSSDPPLFCPNGELNRGQMAVFLKIAFKLPDAPSSGFTDIEGHYARSAIDAIKAAGVTAGCTTEPLRYCPTGTVSRGQMATFISHGLDLRDAPSQYGDPLSVKLTSEAAPVISVEGSLQVTVEFARSVRGFEANDIGVVNGEVVQFSGSGSRYQATVEPAATGTVVVRIPGGAAEDWQSNRNDSSQPLTRTASADGSGQVLGIDTWDRDAVLAAHTAEFDREEPDVGFTGDVDSCVAGTTSQQFRTSVIQRVNWYRGMAGLHPVSEDQESSRLAQHAALMMSAQGDLSHYPDADWACYSAEGSQGAGSSNLFLGVSGLASIDGYVQDPGPNNIHVGHRQWILYPKLTTMGTGDIPHGSQRGRPANALYVTNVDWSLPGEVREERGFVAWPSPGFVPPEVNWTRWSFSLVGADFSAASVEVVDDSGIVEAAVINRDRFVTEAIVWAMDGASDSYLLATGSNGDHCYAVTIRGVHVSGTVQEPYEYAVCVLDIDS